MVLGAMICQQDLFGHSGKDLYTMLGGLWSCDFCLLEKEEKVVSSDIPENQTENCQYSNGSHHLEQWDHSNSVPEENPQLDSSPTILARPRRRQSKSRKNKEEMENQRMTHIAVERNRRKQMNQYLSVLRALVPESYIPRVDQASIVGGAINYVKKLEQGLQFLEGLKHMNQKFEDGWSWSFAEFFKFPQHSMGENSIGMRDDQSTMANIEVSMVESHANLKIRSKKRPKQLLKMVSGLQSLRLTILHLHVTTLDQTVLYSLSVKVEDDCKLTSVDEIATAVNQMLVRIQEEALLD